MTKQGKVLLAGFVLFSLLPIWRSGMRERMTLPQWIVNHTILGPPSEYVPEKYYKPRRLL